MKNVLVTGGGGFLGQAVVEKCLARGDRVWSFSRARHPVLTRMGVIQITGDVHDAHAVNTACEGKDLVFHLAARMGVWGRFSDYYKTNVKGTRNVIAGCKSAGVPILIYTGSTRALRDRSGRYLDGEAGAYPERFATNYGMSKAFAEQAVIKAADQAFRCMVLRPHMIWGPGDRSPVPGLFRQPRWIVRIGNGMNRVSGIYIDNAAQAHLLAADSLAASPDLSGKALLLVEDEPLRLWDLIDYIEKSGGRMIVPGGLSQSAALKIGSVLEWIYKRIGLSFTPFLTRGIVGELSDSHVFDSQPLKKNLGSIQDVTVEKGIERYGVWLKTAHRDSGRRL